MDRFGGGRERRRNRRGGGSPAYAQAGRAAQYIQSRTRLRPQIAVVLGSGLGGFADQCTDVVRIGYERIPYFPLPTVTGHPGRLIVGRVRGVPVATMQGRVHLYEGFSPEQVIFPMRVLGRLGIRAAILTNAAGAISAEYRNGDFVLLRDHINLQGSNPLAGANDERFGARFPDLTEIYRERYRKFARQEAERLGLQTPEGVYAAVHGPSFETPAEIGYLRTIGADLVGMSTVPEAIAAAHLGMRVLGISCVTNPAAGMGQRPIREEEVLETGERVQARLSSLLAALIPRIAEDLDENPERLGGKP